ncbi:MAG: branched-chain amino acid transaminase [Candidatus Micrarchaeota archaeon]
MQHNTKNSTQDNTRNSTDSMQDNTQKIWMNGKFIDYKDANIHVMTHALHYGTGVFEGIRCYKTLNGPIIFRLRDHLTRLKNGSEFYGMNIPYSITQMESATKELVRKNKTEECYLRPIVFRGAGPIGVDPTNAPVYVAIITADMGKYFDEKKMETGIKCKISSWRRISAKIVPPNVKASGQYINSVLAKTEAKKLGYDEAIMLNINERVAEGSGENIFIVKNEEIFTPPISEDILPGITRDSVMQIAKNERLAILERALVPEDLYSADEVFLTGTAAEVTPVRNIDGKIIGSGTRGPITTILQKKYLNAAKGLDKNYENWLTNVG